MSEMKSNNGKYWKSLGQLNESPEAIEQSKKREFMQGVKEAFDVNNMPEFSRRKFLAALGASAAFAATSCSDYRDKGEIITYNNKPDDVYYGQANYYASTMNDGQSILIKTREGRPIKVDGNPEDKISKGKIDTAGQASILNLYDPQRLQYPVAVRESDMVLYNGELTKSEWEKIDKDIQKKLTDAVNSNKEISIIGEKVISPTLNKLIEDFSLKYPTTKYYSYNLFDNSNRINAWKNSYGSDQVAKIKWDIPDVILTLEGDFMGNDNNHLEAVREYTSRRDVDNPKNFNKLYSVESRFSLTGANADYRMRLTPEAQYELVMALINEAFKHSLTNVLPSSEEVAKYSSYSLNSFSDKYGLDKEKVKHLAEDLYKVKDKFFLYAGDILPESVHAAVNYFNEIIGSAKYVYDWNDRAVNLREDSTIADFKQLINKIKTDNVGVLIHFDSNPVYQLPENLNYKEVHKNVKTIISMTELINESSEYSNYLLPIHHAYESWGDFKLRSGYITTQQPVIAPLYITRQKEAILLNWMSEDVTLYTDDIYHKYLMQNWENSIYPNLNLLTSFREFWFSVIHDGVLKYSETLPDLIFNSQAFVSSKANPTKSGYTLVFTKSYTIGDGKFANNGWLQEIPHPISKVVWDNYAAISPDTAKKLNVNYKDNLADMIEVSINGKKLELPVMVQPGMADEVINIELGYGRWNAGTVGSNIGFNANSLLSDNSGISRWIYNGANAKNINQTYELVSTQEHHSLDDTSVKDFHRIRNIIQEATVDDYIHDPDILHHHDHDLSSINPDHPYDEVKWAMAIDLNKCTGCNECVAACNVENNIPVVGKTEVKNGREMHWIRLDRYYSGNPNDPVASLQAMLCQHCDNAPCENVCPVVATTHSPDGLNQMVYNRCVGTRYCANNCPYKVRRFNFFNFRSEFQKGYYEGGTEVLLHNPEVTVRSRGVMEKCTFCVQRIMEGRQEARKEGKTFDGSGIRTACQDACPTEAIVFGNSNDPNSKISKLRKHKLGYHVLEILAVKPNVTYVAKLRNIHAMEGHHSEH